MESTYVPVSGWMDNAAYIHSEECIWRMLMPLAGKQTELEQSKSDSNKYCMFLFPYVETRKNQTKQNQDQRHVSECEILGKRWGDRKGGREKRGESGQNMWCAWTKLSRWNPLSYITSICYKNRKCETTTTGTGTPPNSISSRCGQLRSYWRSLGDSGGWRSDSIRPILFVSGPSWGMHPWPN